MIAANFGDFGIFLVINFGRTSTFLNFFGCYVAKCAFFINWFLNFSMFSVFNEILNENERKLVKRKLMIRIISSKEGNKIFVITLVFPRLKKFCKGVVNCFFLGVFCLLSDLQVLEVNLLSVIIHQMRLANENAIFFFVCRG